MSNELSWWILHISWHSIFPSVNVHIVIVWLNSYSKDCGSSPWGCSIGSFFSHKIFKFVLFASWASILKLVLGSKIFFVVLEPALELSHHLMIRIKEAKKPETLTWVSLIKRPTVEIEGLDAMRNCNTNPTCIHVAELELMDTCMLCNGKTSQSNCSESSS